MDRVQRAAPFLLQVDLRQVVYALSASLDLVGIGDVAGSVGNDADHLIRRIRHLQRAGVDEDVAAIEHERVEAFVANDPHLDAAGAESGGKSARRSR